MIIKHIPCVNITYPELFHNPELVNQSTLELSRKQNFQSGSKVKIYFIISSFVSSKRHHMDRVRVRLFEIFFVIMVTFDDQY